VAGYTETVIWYYWKSLKLDHYPIAVIAAAWCATIAAVDPRGDFPLHDDWIYDVSTWTFARTGQFHFPAFTVTSLRAQVIWGAIWTKLFGESFEVLRISTLLLSLATLIVVARILARAGAAPWVTVFAALALLFNPVFLWSSCTFMTDVPYVFASVVSFYFFARGVTEERLGFIIAGCAAVIVSWFIRQNGVVNLLPPLAILLFARPRRWRSFAAAIIACGIGFAMILLFKREWLSGSPAMFRVHYQMWLESSFRLPEQVSVLYHYIVFNAVNCVLFFLPLTVPLVMIRSRSWPRRALLAIITVLVAYRTVYLAWNGYYVPYSARNVFSDILPGPVFIDFGVGPTTLFDTWHGYPYPFVMPFAARVLLTIVAAVLASLLIWALALARGTEVLKLAIASIVFGTLILFASGLYFDRYALDSAWAVVIALPLIVPWEKRLARALAVSALVALALFSTLAVREYFAWNRARWAAYHDLRAKGVAIEEIEGGAEVEGLYELRDAPLSKARRGHPPRRYVIAFNQLPGYRVIARYPFSGFFGMRKSDVLVLAK
jgi:hypothetical protein